MELNKYFNSITRTVNRSELHLSDYNPRDISDEGRKALKRSIKKYGVVGGIIVNEQTNNTIVGGHQKVSVLDEINHFPDTDYILKAEFINVDLKTEKELNITLNNPNVGGQWDYDKLRDMIPDIDYKSAGLTDEDLNLIGLDSLLKTAEENNIADALTDVMAEVEEHHQEDLQQNKTERAEKISAMKALKNQVKENAEDRAKDMDAYVMLSFDTYHAKTSFMERFGYNESDKFIKGEIFSDQIERVD